MRDFFPNMKTEVINRWDPLFYGFHFLPKEMAQGKQDSPPIDPRFESIDRNKIDFSEQLLCIVMDKQDIPFAVRLESRAAMCRSW